MTNSYFETTCLCGKTRQRPDTEVVFVCSCGRKSVIDFRNRYNEAQLIAMLDAATDDVKRDQLCRIIELKREELTA
jgi:hypothetical protein